MNPRRLRLLLRAFAWVLLIAGVKTLVHQRGWELLRITPLFSGLVSSNVFLMGFLFSGVLADYKESEKLPADLASCLQTLAAELTALPLTRPEAEVRPALGQLAALSADLLGWFRGSRGTPELLDGLDRLIPALTRAAQQHNSPFSVRLYLLAAHLREVVLRMETIRSTGFVPTVYGLAALSSLLLCSGLVLTRLPSWPEAFFYLGVITFLLVVLLLLIGDLDNPFGHGELASCENVCLDPLQSTAERLEALLTATPPPALTPPAPPVP